MGAGIGNMFGIDKIFGGFLDSIGLGALKPLASLAFDFATGNIPGLMQDLTGLMKSFGDGGFTKNVASNPPLPNAFNSNSPVENEDYNTETANQNNAINGCGCRDEGNLSSKRMGEFFKLLGELFSSKDPADMMSKLSKLFKLLSENAEDRQTILNARNNVNFRTAGATVV
jgi:hypothetical protein